MTDTPLARLDRMMATTPHGANALRLLQNLVVFQAPFGRSAVTFMTPEDMSEAESVKAFATLRNWRLVEQITRRRYEIDDSLKQHFPPSPEIYGQAFDYFFRFRNLEDPDWVNLYGRDFAQALLWGLEHRPRAVRDFSRTLGLPMRLSNVMVAQQARGLYLLGQLAHKANAVSVARDVFARALSLITNRSGLIIDILADWSLMEYESDNRHEACALYQQALIVYRQVVETERNFFTHSLFSMHMGTEKRAQFTNLQKLAAMLGCDDV